MYWGRSLYSDTVVWERDRNSIVKVAGAILRNNQIYRVGQRGGGPAICNLTVIADFAALIRRVGRRAAMTKSVSLPK
jgi:hypothetical protein